MTVLRKMPTRYVAVDNAVARDTRLSFRARGVLVYMLSLPESAQVSADRLAEHGKEGRQAVLTALGELRAAGYYRTYRQKVERGRFVTITEVSSDPVEEWLTEVGLPDVGRPNSGEPTPSTEDGTQDETLREGSSSTTLFAVPDDGVPIPTPKPQRQRDPMFDVIAEVCQQDVACLTSSAAGVIGRARRELVAAGATPDEVRIRAEVYRRKFRGADLTPLALAKHWPSLTPPPAPTRDSWLEGYR